MNIKYIAVAIICIGTTVSGCAMYTKTTFSEYRSDNNIFIGKGGTVKVVDGIDVWTHGEPNRKYKVVGIIEQSNYDNRSLVSLIAGATKDSEIITVAKEHGANGLIYLRRDSRITGYSTNSMATGNTTGSISGTYGDGSYDGTYDADTMVQGTSTTHANTRETRVIAAIKYLN